MNNNEQLTKEQILIAIALFQERESFRGPVKSNFEFHGFLSMYFSFEVIYILINFLFFTIIC